MPDASMHDSLIVAKTRHMGCGELVTFDERSASLPGAQLLA
jgi:predicted nucleic-acid-binding protein